MPRMETSIDINTELPSADRIMPGCCAFEDDFRYASTLHQLVVHTLNLLKRKFSGLPLYKRPIMHLYEKSLMLTISSPSGRLDFVVYTVTHTFLVYIYIHGASQPTLLFSLVHKMIHTTIGYGKQGGPR